MIRLLSSVADGGFPDFIKPQGWEPFQFPTKISSPSNRAEECRLNLIVDKLDDDSRAWMLDKIRELDRRAEGYEGRPLATTSRQRSASSTGAEAL
jgi:hypothetical protein